MNVALLTPNLFADSGFCPIVPVINTPHMDSIQGRWRGEMGEPIEREDRGALTVLRFPRQGDTALSDALSDVFYSLNADGRNRVVIDCTNLEFINSMVIGIMVSFHQRAVDKGGGLTFANISLRIEDVFRLTKLDSIFSWYGSVDEAGASLSQDS